MVIPSTLVIWHTLAYHVSGVLTALELLHPNHFLRLDSSTNNHLICSIIRESKACVLSGDVQCI